MRFAGPIAYLLFLSALAAVSVLPLVIGGPEEDGGQGTVTPKTHSYAEDFTDTGESTAVFFFCGDRGGDVEALQKGLLSLGYDVGDYIGVYTPRTAAAVEMLQRDLGVTSDGMADAFVLAAVSARMGEVRKVSEEALWRALRDAGCVAEIPLTAALDPHMISTQQAPTGALRDALILFQRTHGLRGTGGIGYATLCALGLENTDAVTVLHGEGKASDARGDAVRDMQLEAVAEALLAYTERYPDAAQLHTLSCLASLLFNRTEHPDFSDSPTTVFSLGLLSQGEGAVAFGGVENAPLRRICLLAAEEAWERFCEGSDLVGGAVYAAFMKESLPENAVVTAQSGRFFFYR